MLTPELRKAFIKTQHFAKRLAKGQQSGRFRSLYRGQGMDFEEVREYMPGDDVRKMDWNVTARMQQPHIKVYREEKESTLMLCLDSSASMWFGSEKTKVQLAAQIATIFACLSEKQNDRIGLFVYDTDEIAFVSPQSGTDHLWHVLHKLNRLRTRKRSTDTAFALERLMRLPGKRMHILWFSDFLHLSANDSFWTKGVRGLQSKHQLQLIEISDELEKKSSPGLWRDSETGALAIGRGSSSKSTLATGRFAADKVRNLWTAYTSEDLVEIFRRYMLKSTRIEGGPGGQ